VLTLSARAALQDADLDTAESMLQQAIQRFPIDPAALSLYAAVAERQNHPDAARRALIQYEALVASDPDLLAHATKIALLSLRLNDVETAAQWLRRGLDKDPQNAPLLALARRAQPRP
jgi:Flp pilus assembly protein TadD